MKQLSILLLLPLFFACSSSDDNKTIEPTQDYTSFVFVQTVDNNLPNCVVAYLDKDKNYIKVAELGTITLKSPSKEVKLEDDNIRELYFFTDYNHVVRFDAIYTLVKHKKNTFKLEKYTKGVEIKDKKDSKQYPQ